MMSYWVAIYFRLWRVIELSLTLGAKSAFVIGMQTSVEVELVRKDMEERNGFITEMYYR